MSLLGLLAKTGKAAAKGAANVAKAQIKSAVKPVTDLAKVAKGEAKLSIGGGSGSSAGDANVGLGQILGGGDQAAKGAPTTGNMESLTASVQGMMQDSGFYGHNQVEGGKPDKSGFYKHQKEVGQTLF